MKLHCLGESFTLGGSGMHCEARCSISGGFLLRRHSQVTRCALRKTTTSRLAMETRRRNDGATMAQMRLFSRQERGNVGPRVSRTVRRVVSVCMTASHAGVRLRSATVAYSSFMGAGRASTTCLFASLQGSIMGAGRASTTCLLASLQSPS